MWDITKHVNGGYVLAGYKRNINYVNEEPYYTWLVRTDEYGNTLQEYIGQNRDTTETYSRVIHSLPDGTYLCGGTGIDIINDGHNGYIQPEIARRDANFNMMWKVRFGEPCYGQAITEIIPTQDGNFVIGGTILQRYPQYNNSGPFEGFVAKITLDGQVLWQRHYQGIDENHPGGLPPHQEVYDMKLDKDENILICGTSQSNYNGNIPMRAWLLKLDKDGCLVSGCGNVAITEISPQMPLLSAYPNPAQNEITFRLATEAKDCTLSIYDLTSKQVYQGFLERETQVTTQTWAEGIYFYQVKNEKVMIGSGKFVIQH